MTTTTSNKKGHSDLNEQIPYESLIDHSSIVIALIDEHANIKYINKTIRDEFGYTSKEVQNTCLWDYIHPDDLKKTQEHFTSILSKPGKHPMQEYKMKHAHGHWVSVQSSFFNALFDPGTKNIIVTITNNMKHKAIEHELHLCLHKNKSILNALPDLMFIINKDGVFEEYHAFDKEKLVIPPDQIIGRTIDKVGFSEKDLHNIKQAIKRTLQTHSIQTVEYTLFQKEKKQYFEARFAPYGPQSILSIVRDITTQKETQKTLLESEQLYREIFEYAPIGIYRTTPAGQIIHSNATLWKMLGYNSFKELSERNLETEGYHPSYKREFFKKEIETHGRVKGLEATWKKKDGNLIQIRENAHTIFDEQGHIAYYEGTVEDITEKKEIEKLLRRSKEEFRLLIENQQDIIVKIDSEGSLTYVSPSFLRLQRTSNQNPLKSKLENYVHTTDRAMLKQIIHSFNETKDPKYLELRIISDDGWRWIAWIFNPFTNEETNTIDIIAIGRDITTQKETETQLSETKERMQSIVDYAKDIILSFDMNGRVSTWNKSVERLTGFPKKTVLFKRPTKVKAFKNPKDLEKNLTEIFREKQTELSNLELCLITKEGEERPLSCSYSIIYNKERKPIDLLVIGRYETEKTIETLVDGNAYLYTDDSKTDMFRRFQNLIEKGYHGLCITRGNNEQLKELSRLSNCTLFVLSKETIQGYPIISSPSDLVEQVQSFVHKKKPSVIVIDRLDLFFSYHPFEEVMKSIYLLHSLTINSKTILLIHINTSLITDQQLALLKEELSDLLGEQIEDIILESDFYNILLYIKRENDSNSAVPYKDIGKTFSISKVTTQKRIKMLEEKGLISIKKRGKMKILTITKKAEIILKKQK
jgi:PAS domain S-box-containing protein